MSRNTKIIIGVVVGLVVLCVCLGVEAAVLFRSATPLIQKSVSVSEDPEEIAEIAKDIVDYDLPPGYREQFGMSFFSFDFVGFGPTDSKSPGIMLMQFPNNAGLSQEEMELQMHQSLQQQTGQRDWQMQVVDQLTTTIRDQTVTLTISEGTDDKGENMRQISGTFEGKNGIVLLMIMGKQQTWDQESIDAFLSSLR
ncbi:hypothetical protein ACFLXQ_03880 [Chloroflexota bacterium]